MCIRDRPFICAQHAPISGKNKEKHNGYTVEEVSGLWSKVKYYSRSKQVWYKHRRLWRLAVATHPRTQADWVLSCGFRGAGPMSWNPLQAAKQRSCGYVSSPISPTSVPRRGTYTSPIMLMMVGPASRNQEKVMSVYPTAALLRSLQWVSDRYVSHRDTALIGALLWEAAGLRGYGETP